MINHWLRKYENVGYEWCIELKQPLSYRNN